MLRGQYRVDENGEIVASHHETMEVTNINPAYEIVHDIKRNYVVRDSPIYDSHLQQIGHGDKAFTALLDGDHVIGCLYTDTLLDGGSLTQSQIEMLNLYGATLGVLFNRQRAQEALKTSEQEALLFQQQLKQLNEVTIELASIESLDELCRQTVILGLERLGFDRIGIWLTLEDRPNMRRGMWGTDKDGNLRDERSVIVPVPEHEAMMASEGDIVALHDYELRDIDGESLGTGWNVVGLMWDGMKRIGWLYADNVRNLAPLTQKRYELFRLYTATIGLLYARQMANAQLRESEIRYRAITEASSDVIAIVNKQSVVTYISPSLKIVMGVEPDTIIGKSVDQIIHLNDIHEATEILEECFQSSGLQTRMNSVRVRHAKGHWVHMEAMMTSMVDDPIINGVVISCRDLTHRLVAEERKRIVERERERALVLRQFISDISHDFRTPLSTISTTAYLLKKGNRDLIEQRIDTIDQQVERLANLISSLNTITRLDETRQISMNTVNINRILQSIPYNKDNAIAEKQLKLELELYDSLPTIRGSASLLTDAIYHLIDNAIQFCELEDSINIQSYTENEFVVIQIEDTGMGIAEEDLPFIFDRLYRADKARSTHTGGSGLGLAIARRIIELHEGAIEITSQLNMGTTVQIHLPYE